MRSTARKELCCLLLLGVLGGCSDPAVRLRFSVVDQLRALERAGHEQGTTMAQTGVDVDHWVVLIPSRPTVRSDLEQAGVDPAVAARIFSELAYVGVGSGRAMLVVVPDVGRLSFTGPERVRVDQLSVARCSSSCRLDFQRLGDGWVLSVLPPFDG